MCYSRRNVRPADRDHILAFPLGLISHFHGLSCSSYTRKYTELCLQLNAFMRAAAPQFRYTTIQLNNGYSSKLHVDSNNEGPSMIMAVGEFTGGDLWIYDVDGKVIEPVKEKMKGWKSPIGAPLPGKVEQALVFRR